MLSCDRMLLSLAIQLFIQQILEALLSAQIYSRPLRHTLNKMDKDSSLGTQTFYGGKQTIKIDLITHCHFVFI